ncbi:MAG: VCBS repeat-containing protein, partial [Lewinella sp.]
SCEREPPMAFRSLPAVKTGVDFVNRITVTDTFNALRYEYIYNGAGVGIGDLNGDGLPDVYFAGNQVSSRLYLNRGSMTFDDVTEMSQVGTRRWCTGVSIADVNGDGRNDIYVSAAGFGIPPEERANLLFLNQGNGADGVPLFVEAARSAGLADTAYTSQTAFLDYDLDGDMDAYVLNNALEAYNRNRLRSIRTDGGAPATDHLYRNEGNGVFTDVTLAAGLGTEGYGLGVTVSDLNGDGWPDVYVANDFLSNDLVWVNNGDGTFTDRSKEYFPHTSHNGMGVDIADLDNDLLPDVLELDMLPAGNYRQKMMTPYVNRDRFTLKADFGYQDQYMRNTLQINRGNLADGHPRFTDIGALAGVHATDWSWAVLLADYDLDGRKDIYVTNGYRKDVTNLDFISYGPYNAMFGDAQQKELLSMKQLASIEEVPLPNYFFKADGDFRYTEITESWISADPSYATGAAYGDLDLDGDIDLIVNNIDQPASILENRAANTSGHHYLSVSLEGRAGIVTATHSRVFLYVGDDIQVQELFPVRGYLSSVEPRLIFGLGDKEKIDSVVVVWNDGYRQRISEPASDTSLTIRYNREGPKLAGHYTPAKQESCLDRPDVQLPYVHRNIRFDDFRNTFTLPHGFSQQGPALAVGDVNQDGLNDIVAGGGPGQGLSLLSAHGTGEYELTSIDSSISALITDVALFDADNDGDQDIYAVVGGTHLPAGDPEYQDRFYRNDGNGHFKRHKAAIPAFPFSGSCVRLADYDLDGDVDLFVGSQVVPGAYPHAPPSHILQNDGGVFSISGSLDLGMVHDARWVHAAARDRPVLIVAAEWEPLRQLRRDGDGWKVDALSLVGSEGESLSPPTGWWFHLNAADVDGDGDTDLIAGNLGHNIFLQATPKRPVDVWAKDFDGNGSVDPLLFHYQQDKLVPLHERDLLLRQIPSMKRRFPDYKSYAEAGLAEVLTPTDREGSLHRQATDFTSYYLENNGRGQYRAHPLPAVAQFGPVRHTLLYDFSGDGKLDMLLTGNFHQTEITQLGKHDGNYGTLLIQDPDGEWSVADKQIPRPHLPGQVSALALSRADGGQRLLVGTYGDTLRSYALFPTINISR